MGKHKEQLMEVTSEDKVWMDVAGVCNYLSLSKETVYRMVKNKTIPFHRLGEKLIRFHRGEIDLFVSGGVQLPLPIEEVKDEEDLL